MDDAAISDLVARARAGDAAALSELFEEFRPRLARMVALRLHASLKRRLDPSDVVQEAWLEVQRRFPHWSVEQSPPLHVWLRLVTGQLLVQAHRHHLGARMRDAQLERGAAESRPSVSADSVADAFVASATSPTQAVRREEVRSRVLAALEGLDEIDREIIALREFEGLSNKDAAAELGLEPSASSRRFLNALVRLRPVLQSLRADAR
jgi:RNA polymerase sigma-70 factor (ECF subfamily)